MTPGLFSTASPARSRCRPRTTCTALSLAGWPTSRRHRQHQPPKPARLASLLPRCPRGPHLADLRTPSSTCPPPMTSATLSHTVLRLPDPHTLTTTPLRKSSNLALHYRLQPSALRAPTAASAPCRAPTLRPTLSIYPTRPARSCVPTPSPSNRFDCNDDDHIKPRSPRSTLSQHTEQRLDNIHFPPFTERQLLNSYLFYRGLLTLAPPHSPCITFIRTFSFPTLYCLVPRWALHRSTACHKKVYSPFPLSFCSSETSWLLYPTTTGFEELLGEYGY